MKSHTHLPFQNPDDEPRFSTMREDWFGHPLESAPSFRLVIGSEFLEFYFTARREPLTAPGAERGEYYEGLWDYDCAELYLVNPATGHYLELNLAPNGAWWSNFFEEPRVQAEIENLPLPGVESEGLEGVAHWEARLRVPRASLPDGLAFDPKSTLGNVAVCLGSEPRQTYVSWARLPGERPDYHQPGSCLPLRRLRARAD